MQAEPPLSEHAERAARTYGAAADHYTKAALSFWDRFGSATVSRLPLAAGDAVLDLCCGAGASAIPAAHEVGPAGRGCPALASTRSSVFSVCASRRTCPDSWPRCGGWFGRAGYWR